MLPFLLLSVWTLTLYAAVGVYAARNLGLGWVLPFLIAVGIDAALFCCCWRGCCRLYCCGRRRCPSMLLLVYVLPFILLLLDGNEAFYLAVCGNTYINTTYITGSSTTFLPPSILEASYPVPSAPSHTPLAALSLEVSSGDEAATNQAALLAQLDSERRDPALENSRNDGSPDSPRSSPEQPSTAPVDQPSPGPLTPLREKESRLREETAVEQPSPGSEAHQPQPSPGSVERHRLVSPGTAARQRQGSSRGRDARDGSLHVPADAARSRLALEVAKATTLRRKGRLRQMQRDIAEAESAEREAAAVAAKAQSALDRDIWTDASGAAATCSPPTREEGITSQSE